MILIVGAEASGKKTFAMSLGYKDEDISDACINERPVVWHLEQIVFDDPDVAKSLFPSLAKKDIVICNEVGSGVIPLTHKERDAREACGRLCCDLAMEAEHVYRLVSGIPVKIK